MNRLHAIEGKQKGKYLFSSMPKPSPLFEREKDIKDLKEAISNHRITVVEGLRRVGKSSLVLSVLNDFISEGIIWKEDKGEKIKGEDIIPLYVRMEPIEEKEDLADCLKKGTEYAYDHDHLGLKTPGYVKKFEKLLNGRTAEISRKHGFEMSPSLAKYIYERVTKKPVRLSLRGLFDAMDKTAEQMNKHLIIVLDEIQGIIKCGQDFVQNFQELLAYINDELHNIKLVITGSHSRLIPIVLDKRYKAPLYGRDIVNIPVPPFNDVVAKNYLLSGFQELNIEFKEEWAENVVKVFGGIVGVLANYGREYEETIRKVTNPSGIYSKVLEKAFTGQSEAVNDTLETFFAYNTIEGVDKHLCLEIIKAVSKHKFEDNLNPSISQIHGISNGTLKRALKILKDYEIIAVRNGKDYDILDEGMWAKEDKVVLINPSAAVMVGTPPVDVLNKVTQPAKEILVSEKIGISEEKVEITEIPSPRPAEEEENVLYIGNKPVMSYVLATVTMFNNGFNEVVLRARGRAISRAVDTAEVVMKKFLPGIEIKDLKIGTESIEGEGGDKANVSSMEITMKAKA